MGNRNRVKQGKMLSQDFEVRGFFSSFCRFFTLPFTSQVHQFSHEGESQRAAGFSRQIPSQVRLPSSEVICEGLHMWSVVNGKLRLRFNVDSTLDTCNMGLKVEVGPAFTQLQL